MNKHRIAVDFDGTIVDHQYPLIGRPNPGAIDWLIRLMDVGAELILWTMRSGDALTAAVAYCKQRELYFDAVNEGIGDREWTESPKAYATIYIDDAAFGCPLITIGNSCPMVDWSVVGPAIYEDMTDSRVETNGGLGEEDDTDLGMYSDRGDAL